ncbi:ABC transporter related protein [Hyella patelloides LEGE 07179]|uniref:ABC transporter related protein n=1 Tax=Hyella patelloides LEGE 07179 TaxID=945734 RepID=A0A563VZA8_9CYAN|nr:ABC transporter ATP-binding protein [Hyella patelloides]VEP16802.1 ABC transporter related protein [Hyella patelloides LEGE 07179]
MKKYIIKFLYILSDDRKYLFFLALAFILTSSMDAISIGIIGPFVSLAINPNKITQNTGLNWAYQYFNLSLNQFLAYLGLLIIIIFCLKSVISFFTQFYIFRLSYRQKGKLANRLLKAYLRAPYTFHLTKNSAQIINHIVSETHIFSNGIMLAMLNLASNCIIIIILTILLCITNLVTIIAVVVSVCPVLILLYFFKHRIKNWGEKATKANQAMVEIINHSLGGIKETKIIGCEPYFEQQLVKQSTIFANVSSSLQTFSITPRIVIEMFLIVVLIGFISLYLAFNQNIQNQNVQDITSVISIFALASVRLKPAIVIAVKSMTSLRNGTYILDKLYLDLKEIENIEIADNYKYLSQENIEKLSKNDSNSVNKMMLFTDQIVLDSLNYRYPNAVQDALKDISIAISKGESIAFIGKSGTGKTTLVDVILGLLQPYKGDIQVDNNSIYSNLRNWQNLVGYIPQSIFLINETLEKNVAFGVPEDLINRQKLHQAIKAAQLEEVVENLPLGLKTIVGERGILLSGGQRQRVGIARALYHEREILVLDEATAALDNETESLITEAIRSLSGQKTMIIIAHRLTTVKHCNCIYLMEKGRIIQSGSYEEVVTAKHKFI